MIKLDPQLIPDEKFYDHVGLYRNAKVQSVVVGSKQQNYICFRRRDGATTRLKKSEEVIISQTVTTIGERMEGPVINNNKSGLHTMQVSLKTTQVFIRCKQH